MTNFLRVLPKMSVVLRHAQGMACFLAGISAGAFFRISPDIVGYAALSVAVFIGAALLFEIASVWVEEWHQ